MNKVCLGEQTVFGYDVSHHQDLHVHQRMKMAGAKFCLIKADEGTRFHDPMFKKHWQAAKEAGMLTGAYNFFHPKQDPITQAKDLMNIVGVLGDGDFGAICDDETMDGIAPGYKNHADEAHAFMSRCQDVLKKQSICYGSPFFLRDTVKVDTRFSQFLLWLANYGVKCPNIPFPWPKCDFWQYTDAGGLDLNLYNGNLASLNALTGVK